MTTALTKGFGGLANTGAPTAETAALRDINSRRKSFVNKDFTRNIAWLNQSVDTLSAYTQKLQAGVDKANQDAVEQITGFWADLFVMFGGLEPTGIHVGDVKYIIQGLGALFGINPDTPFPLNLFEAALNLFEQYIIPLDQFTDVIFDAIDAWAVELGLSPEFIDSLHELFDAISGLTSNFEEFFGAISDLMNAFGFPSFGNLGELWDALVNLIDGLALDQLKPVLSLLADLGIPFINALTAIVNTGSIFLGIIPISSLTDFSPELLVNPGFDDSISIQTNGEWDYDPSQGKTTLGCAKFVPNGTERPGLSSNAINCVAGQEFTLSVWVKWATLAAGVTDVMQLTISKYDSTGSLVGYEIIDAIDSPGSNSSTYDENQSGWVKLSGTYTIPTGVSAIRLRLKVSNAALSGNIWFDDASVTRSGLLQENWIGGLVEKWASLLGIFGGGFPQMANFVANILQMFDVLDIFDLADISPEDFNPLTIWARIVTNIINPLNLIQDLFSRTFLQNIVDVILHVLSGIPFVGGSLADLFEKLLGLKQTADIAVTASNPPIVAQSGRIDALQAQIASGTEGLLDHLNRAALGTDWTTVSGQETPILQDNAYAWGNTNRAAAYASPGGTPFEFATNEWQVQASIAAITDHRTVEGISGIARLWVGDAGMTNYVAIRAQWGAGWETDAHFAISTGTSPSATTIRSDEYDIDKDDLSDGDVLKLAKRFDSISSLYTYTLYLNTDPICTWTDSTSILTSAAGNRKVGFVLNAEGFSSTLGIGWDDISASDKTN